MLRPMKRQDKADRIGRMLDDLYPEPPIPLDHQDPFTLLIAVLLSAQTTDERVNMTTPEQALAMIGANLVVSNVRGSDKPMYVAGARMATMYPMSIISPGIAINFTCLSYADKVDFGVTIEPELVPDRWAIIAYVRKMQRDQQQSELASAAPMRRTD